LLQINKEGSSDDLEADKPIIAKNPFDEPGKPGKGDRRIRSIPKEKLHEVLKHGVSEFLKKFMDVDIKEEV